MKKRTKKRSYFTEEFTCVRDSFRIVGTVFRKKGQTQKAIPVIFSHGFMGNRWECVPYAIELAEVGFVVFTYDFVGGATDGRSGGTLEDMTILTEKEDLRAVMDFVKTCDYVEYSDLVLAGCSQGGFVSGLTAVDYPEEVKRLILLYPALCIPDDARKGSMLAFSFDPANVPDRINGGGLTMSGDYPRSVMDLNAIDLISDFPGDVLILAGKKDPIVGERYMDDLYAAFRTKRGTTGKPDPSVQLWIMKEAGHGFFGEIAEMALTRMKYFLRGYDEVLLMKVSVTGFRKRQKRARVTVYLPFDAECDTDYFNGTSLPGSMDVQKWKRKNVIERKADYRMQGTDANGEACEIHVINRDVGRGWEPMLETKNESLAFFNTAKGYAIVEESDEGLLIHILSKPE